MINRDDRPEDFEFATLWGWLEEDPEDSDRLDTVEAWLQAHPGPRYDGYRWVVRNIMRPDRRADNPLAN